MKVELLCIDPQRDFCEPGAPLYVLNAEKDMSRLAKMVKRLVKKISDIHVTLDSHHMMDVAHPCFWKDSNGNNPNPFTIISAQDVENGVWVPVISSLYKRMLSYVKTLESSKRYPLCIWPPHCLIGTPGHAVFPELYSSLVEWEVTNYGIVDYVTKGSNPYTEHYSAVKAEVPDPSDRTTQINSDLIQVLKDADLVVIAGEAGSHCLANTVVDIADAFGDDSYIKKLVLLEDATSPVVTPAYSFAPVQADFIAKMVARGMQISTTEKFLK